MASGGVVGTGGLGAGHYARALVSTQASAFGLGELPPNWELVEEAQGSLRAALAVFVDQPAQASLADFTALLRPLALAISAITDDQQQTAGSVHSGEFWAVLSFAALTAGLPTLPSALQTLLLDSQEDELALGTDSAHVLASLQILVKQVQGQDTAQSYIRAGVKAWEASGGVDPLLTPLAPLSARSQPYAPAPTVKRDYLAEARDFLTQVRSEAEREAEAEFEAQRSAPPTAEGILLAQSIYKRTQMEIDYEKRKAERIREREAREYQRDVRADLDRQALRARNQTQTAHRAVKQHFDEKFEALRRDQTRDARRRLTKAALNVQHKLLWSSPAEHFRGELAAARALFPPAHANGPRHALDNAELQLQRQHAEVSDDDSDSDKEEEEEVDTRPRARPPRRDRTKASDSQPHYYVVRDRIHGHQKTDRMGAKERLDRFQHRLDKIYR